MCKLQAGEQLSKIISEFNIIECKVLEPKRATCSPFKLKMKTIKQIGFLVINPMGQRVQKSSNYH